MQLLARARIVARLLDLSLAVSLAAVCGALLWEFATEQYLSGFTDAIVPTSATEIQKTQAIRTWMERGPARAGDADPQPLLDRDPRETLNYSRLLHDCGSATNAFVNLARRGGLRARRL